MRFLSRKTVFSQFTNGPVRPWLIVVSDFPKK
jgi:hypothetical protein